MSDERDSAEPLEETGRPGPMGSPEPEFGTPLGAHEGEERRGPTNVDVGSTTGAPGVSGTHASDFRVQDSETHVAEAFSGERAREGEREER